MRRLLSVILGSAALASGGPEPAIARKALVPTSTKTIFYCRTNRLFRPKPAIDGAPSPRNEAGAGQPINGDIRLTLDVGASTMTLFVRSTGSGRRAYPLKDVAQGSSLGSGAGGRADTTIRGKSGGDIFTLSASYENNGATQEAELQIVGRTTVDLVCGDGQFQSPRAIGIGRYGSTGIFTLSADGVAKETKDIAGMRKNNNLAARG